VAEDVVVDFENVVAAVEVVGFAAATVAVVDAADDAAVAAVVAVAVVAAGTAWPGPDSGSSRLAREGSIP
jgi:hypothetical protein